ncbi:MAG: hypothetical protein QGH75_03010, partial [Pseudomonadales bacterium]|nr:hypothetical protein [Pseudomonadales bacterium]
EGVLAVGLIFIAPFVLYYLISRFIPILDYTGETAEPDSDSRLRWKGRETRFRSRRGSRQLAQPKTPL